MLINGQPGQTKEYWKNQAKAKYHSLHSIKEGSQGIFATCDRGREARCVEEMYRLLEQVGSKNLPLLL